MIELLLIANIITSEPQTYQQQQNKSEYKVPEYQKPSTGSSPSQKQIEEFEREMFEHPNG